MSGFFVRQSGQTTTWSPRFLGLQPFAMRWEESLAHTHKSHFAKLRRILVKRHGRECSICRSPSKERGDIHAHEVWQYAVVADWEHPRSRMKKVLRFTLTDIVLLCAACHYFTHQGNYFPDKNHYCKVNGCSQEEFEQDKAAWLAAIAEFRKIVEASEKQRRHWRRVVDFGWFDPGVDLEEADDPWEARDSYYDLYEEQPLWVTRGGTPVYASDEPGLADIALLREMLGIDSDE